MKSPSLQRFASILSCLVLSVAVMFSQVSGRISGTVTDSTGASIPNARVVLSIQGTVITETKTTSEGIYAFTSLRPASYDIKVEAAGFTAEVVKAIKVDAARETPVAPITLNPAGVQATVEVSAVVTTVNTSNAEVSQTISKSQVALLPQLNRSPLALISTQAGVGSNGRTNTTINGMRPSYTNITIDGVNIQDNYIRTNALDFLPNLLLLDQIAEMTVSTSNTNATIGGGAGQISFVTPSGTNDYHGSLYWYNRNNALAANSWFNNRDRVALPFLNQNQAGGTFGGRIIKDKLFFFTNYEAYRLRQQASVNRTILTQDARNGIFTYQDTAGNTQKVNLLTKMNRTMDPTMKALIDQLPAASAINNFRAGDSSDALLRNTAGYSYNQRSNRDRNNFLGKVDYLLNSKISAFGTIMWNSDLLDRSNITSNVYLGLVPVIKNDNKTWFGSYGIRWTPTPTITNEIRGGYNLAPGIFASDQKNPDFFVGGLVFSNPVETFLPQGRYTDTYNLADNGSWVKGSHTFSFGFQGQLTRVYTYNDAGIVPTYTLGISGQQQGFVLADFPGIRSSDLAGANNLYANLAGLLSSASQTFNVKDRTSGFVPNQTNGRNLSQDLYAGYFQDNWKVSRKLSVQAGIRYEYWTRVNERDALELVPLLVNNNPIQTLLSNATLDFAGTSVGRPYYKKDLNNFAPNLGLAYDPFGNGKTVIRAGYSLNYVNDNMFRSIENAVSTGSGLQQGSSISNLAGTLAGKPTVPTPGFKVPRTLYDNYQLNQTTALAMVDPNLVTPYVQQWSLSVQRDIKGGVLDVRYIGNHGTKQFRGFDFNQININGTGFLADFKRAYNNALASQANGGSFNPGYTGPGSTPLTVFPLLGSQGALSNATVVNYFLTQQPGELAYWYQTNRYAGPLSTSGVSFFNNPYGAGMNLMTNYSNSSYNAFQVDYTRRYSKGFLFQINYTYAKSMSDTLGDGQTGFEAFLDMNNASLEKARTPFDQTHALKSNGAWYLPFGKGKKYASGVGPVVDRIIGGWSISGIFSANSGNPFGILSERGTLNRAARSSNTNTATTSLTKSQLDDLFQLRFTGSGPYFIGASAIGSDGRGVSSDGTAPFNGQVFFNPGAGTLGGLQRRYFSGPSWWNLDFGIQKKTQLTERQSIELRLESTNVFNHSTFYFSDDATYLTSNINSTNFGKVLYNQTSPRRVQIGLYYRF